MIRTAAVLIATLALMGCPPADKPKADPKAADVKKPTKSDKKADAEAKKKAAAAAKSVVPAGVVHVKNDKWEDKEASKDKPAVDTKASAEAVGKAGAAFTAQHKKACAAGAAKVVTLTQATSRVGYESYKNGNLPVKGMFKSFGGYAVLGETPELHFWADVLSLNSGDPTRDARLLKLFFEAEKPDNALITFEADSLTGLADGKVPPKGGVIEAKGKLSLHGVSVPLTLKLKLIPAKEQDTWMASLAEDTLLPFDPHALAEPLKTLLAACNHKTMGSSVKLEFDLKLAAGCK